MFWSLRNNNSKPACHWGHPTLTPMSLAFHLTFRLNNSCSFFLALSQFTDNIRNIKLML